MSDVAKLAAELTGTMAEALMNGLYNEGSASIILPKNNLTRKALVRRGLVHDGDNRWTALGREVARHLPEPWNSVAVKSLDELHGMAIGEDWVRTAAATDTPVAYDGEGGVIVPGAHALCLRATGVHAAHMKAVSPECRDEQGSSADENGGCTKPADDPIHPLGDGADDDTEPMPPNSSGNDYQRHFGDDYLLPVCEASGGTLTVVFNAHLVTCPACLRWLADHPGAGQRFAEQPPHAGDMVEWIAVAPFDAIGMVTDVTPEDVSIRWTNRATGEQGFDHPTLEGFPHSWRVLARENAAHGLAPVVHFGRASEDRPRYTPCGKWADDVTTTFDRYKVTCGTCEAEGSASLMPQVPGDLTDDEAWRRYCDALPAPTDDELARTIAEFASPYAEQIDQCQQAFRIAARVIWHARRHGGCTPRLYRTQRTVMETSRACMQTYRGLAREWARRAVASMSA